MYFACCHPNISIDTTNAVLQAFKLQGTAKLEGVFPGYEELTSRMTEGGKCEPYSRLPEPAMRTEGVDGVFSGAQSIPSYYLEPYNINVALGAIEIWDRFMCDPRGSGIPRNSQRLTISERRKQKLLSFPPDKKSSALILFQPRKRQKLILSEPRKPQRLILSQPRKPQKMILSQPRKPQRVIWSPPRKPEPREQQIKQETADV